ncbi:MAG: hypothetical protein GF353_10610, partial [Candidatus Lokiarchaeota archaeon]|nr:hypothetical protein [Candidatus Lokiarchaeota archaeon]
SIIVFKIGWEEFAIDLLSVKEIIRAGQIRRLPQSFDFVVGIYNYRGEIIHIIDLKKKLNLDEYRLYKKKKEIDFEEASKNLEGESEEEQLEGDNGSEKKEKNDKSIEKKIQKQTQKDGNSTSKFIIIVNINDTNIGFYVDKIYNVSHINLQDIIGLSPIFQTSLSVEYIKGIIKFKDRPRILIDLSKILSETEKKSIQNELSLIK